MLGKASGLGQMPAMDMHRYTLRTLREGFVYVYLNKPGLWQVYAVTEQGNLRLLPDPDDIDRKVGQEMSTSCTRSGDNIPASFIHIKYVKATPVVWIGFSSARWTKAVREKYERRPAERMQRFDCKALETTPDTQPDAFDLDGAATKLTGLVDEYAATDIACLAERHYNARQAMSGQSDLMTWTSAHGHGGRPAQAQAMEQYVQCYRDTRGAGHTAAAIVLHDAMGAVQEANATRLHFVEARQKTCEVEMRRLTVSQSIMGLKKVIETSTLSARTAQEIKEGKPDVQTERIFLPDDLPRMSQQLEITTTRAERARTDATNAWSRLAKRYDEGARKAFEDRFNSAMDSFAKTIEYCDHDWAELAKTPQWTAWIADYDNAGAEHRVQLVRDCAPCLAGGVIGTPSYERWKTWLAAKPDAKDNPVYKVLFGNAPRALQFLDPTNGENKADDLYDVIKGLADSDQFKQHVAAPAKAAVADTLLALAGAASEVESRMLAAGEAINQRVFDIVLRAQQGAMLLYEGVETTVLRVQLTVGEYQRMLARQAFKGLGKASAAAKEVLDSAGRRVRSLAVAGLLDIDDPKIRDFVINATIWSFEKAAEVQRQVAALRNDIGKAWGAVDGQGVRDDVRRARQEFLERERQAGGVIHATNNALRNAQLGAMLLSEQAARNLASLRAGITVPAGRLLGFSRDVAGKSLRVAGSGSVILAAGAVFMQGWAFKNSMKDLDEKLGPRATEAQLALTSAGIGVVGGTVELVGAAMEKSGALLGRSALEATGKAVVRVGATVAAVASVVDSVQSIFALLRARERGDDDAKRWYGLAAAAYFFAAGFGGFAAYVGMSSLLGPLGIALALVAIGVIATWAAINAEDTQAEIWLDRCCFGYGKRSEGKWSDEMRFEELAELNAILVGLSAQMGFSDAWLGLEERVTGYETITFDITLGSYSPGRSALEWRLYAVHERRGEITAHGGRLGLPPAQHYVSASPSRGVSDWFSRDKPEDWFRNFEGGQLSQGEGGLWSIKGSFDVQREKFQTARLKVDYWPDYSDKDALATLTLKDKD
ncbi:hypothetical protein EER27_04140 [Lysobacter psychrotolerans]|uniref:Toxin VasX N-terminal region domain-containing protein n=1 Tax=Montanilutibacter psychrotolerans TaxID=1327343 RepID=A0A3M8SUH3_9GAMM|nr:hypothetical protein EER27_04140 [Lysobacter psychrotolerans]